MRSLLEDFLASISSRISFLTKRTDIYNFYFSKSNQQYHIRRITYLPLEFAIPSAIPL